MDRFRREVPELKKKCKIINDLANLHFYDNFKLVNIYDKYLRYNRIFNFFI
jgi:hypothetical protein